MPARSGRPPSGPRVDACANPLCRLPVHADHLDALELVQVQPDPDRPGATLRVTWVTHGLDCARQYLALCDLRHLARAHPETSEAEA